VVFYDRGAAGIGVETSEGTGNSFLFIDGEMFLRKTSSIRMRQYSSTG